MNSEPIKRKLTVIFYLDVAGYSSLTGADEEGTHRQVMQALDDANEAISANGGSVLRYAGDAILAEFDSAVVAVNTAIAVQQARSSANATTEQAQQIRFRIGINLGDVIVDRGEVFGDGVNLAARLEAAAPSGGVCVSAAVHDQVVGKIDHQFENCGNESFKNIDRPVHVFRLHEHMLTDQDYSQAAATNTTDNVSIAVLALTNMNRDEELDFIGDGLTEDLITALSKIRAFKVISRESSFSYKGTAIDIRQVAKELGVRYVLEGSVRKAGSRVRVTAQLIDAETGHHVWAEKYDREMEDIFELQDEMTSVLASALEPELNAAERARILRRPPNNLDAWELYQRALSQMWSYEEKGVGEAIELFKQANQADPGFAPAYAYLAYSHYITVIMGYSKDADQSLQLGLEAARNALQCDSKDAISYFAVGRIYMMLGRLDEAVDALRHSIDLNPCFAQAYHGLGMALALSGDLEESKKSSSHAVTASPKDPMMWAFTIVHALTCVLNNENEEGLDWCRKTLQIPNVSGYWTPAVMAAALANLGRVEEAEKSLDLAVKAMPDLSLAYLKKSLPTKKSGGLDPYLKGLEAAGLQ